MGLIPDRFLNHQGLDYLYQGWTNVRGLSLKSDWLDYHDQRRTKVRDLSLKSD